MEGLLVSYQRAYESIYPCNVILIWLDAASGFGNDMMRHLMCIRKIIDLF